MEYTFKTRNLYNNLNLVTECLSFLGYLQLLIIITNKYISEFFVIDTLTLTPLPLWSTNVIEPPRGPGTDFVSNETFLPLKDDCISLRNFKTRFTGTSKRTNFVVLGGWESGSFLKDTAIKGST